MLRQGGAFHKSSWGIKLTLTYNAALTFMIDGLMDLMILVVENDKYKLMRCVI